MSAKCKQWKLQWEWQYRKIPTRETNSFFIDLGRWINQQNNNRPLVLCPKLMFSVVSVCLCVCLSVNSLGGGSRPYVTLVLHPRGSVPTVHGYRPPPALDPLGSQHGSWTDLFHIPVSRHWWSSKGRPIGPQTELCWLGSDSETFTT